jgi:hypothetical protein
MRLSLLSENSFVSRVKSAFKKDGLNGIQNEFGVDINTAVKYLNTLKSGTYGEHDIEDKVLHRARAPQCALSLMRHFGIDPSIIKKVLKLHTTNMRNKSHARMRSGDKDTTSINRLANGDKLVALINQQTPGVEEFDSIQFNGPSSYVFEPQNRDVAELLLSLPEQSLIWNMMRGLAFGYPMSDVVNFVRQDNVDLVDNICGNVDRMEK